MAYSLKAVNNYPLLLVTLLNLAAYFIIVKSGSVATKGLMVLIRDWNDALPAGIGVLITGLINAQLSSDMKARLVFWRWCHPLPGCEAFSRHALHDVRIDFSALERKFNPLPTASRDQNALWYKMYKTVERDPSVTYAHQQEARLRICLLKVIDDFHHAFDICLIIQ